MPRRSLDQYQRMRDFDATPEPAGDVEPTDRRRFVIQQHSATRLHWDLRLEHEGVLLSWALPRGLPWSPKQNHLAVHTEDHPLEYLGFRGDIPVGSYGAGSMFIWDTGTYDAEKLTDTKVTFTLHGERASGRYALFQTGGKNWMIHRMDPPEDPTREHLPEFAELIDAEPGALPTDDGWAFEVRWSGERVLVASSGGVVTISDRQGRDVGASFPEIRRIGRHLGMTEVILDGVIVDPEGDPDAVAHRLAAKSDSTIRSRAKAHPLALVAFDVLWLDGHSTVERPWADRRAELDRLALDAPEWRAPAAHLGDGEAMLDAARQQGLPGLIAKRTDAPYESATWIRLDA